MNTSILFTELYHNVLFEGNYTSSLNGNIPGDSPECTWGCFPPIRHALQHLLLSQFTTITLRPLTLGPSSQIYGNN